VKTKELDDFCRKLADSGKLVEAGFWGLRIAAIPDDAPQVQVDEMRNAFFAGAQHMFGSIMQILEPGSEATEKDLHRLTLIDIELREFIEQFKRRHK
jgi:hypothetical protein